MSNLLSQASLVMIPSGYKEDIVYSPVPTNGNGDLSFTRASNGTRINSAGLVEVTPWNLVQESESIGVVSPWSNSNLTITANSVIAPNGTTTADVLTETTATTTQFRTQQTTPQSNNIYTLSVYVKNITGTRQAYIDLGPVTGFFNFATETTYSASAIASFENVGNGWYRFSLTTANPITPSTIYLGLGQNNSETYTGNGTSAIAFWGAQLNIGSTAKPYFPTTDRLNVPRLTYQNGGGGCPSLLLEKQSTNLLTYSEEFDNANWTKAQGNGGTLPIITANYGISPDGTQNADRIQLTRTTQTSSFSYVYQTYIGTIGLAYTWSIWLKSLSGTPSVALSYDGSSYVNIVTLTTEWQRYTFTSNAINTSIQATFLLFQNLSGTSLSADFLAWGFQLEASSYPTSYIPTTSSSATRVADACYKTGISSLIGQTEGVLFADFVYLGETQSEVIDISDGTENNRVMIYITSVGTFQVYVTTSATTDGFIVTSYTPIVGSRYKVAVAYKSNDIAFYVNGSLLGTDTSATIPTTSKLTISNGGAGNYLLASQFNQSVLFKTRLTNAELASLTTI